MKVNKLKVVDEREIQALTKQWTEYADIYLKKCHPSYHSLVLNDLNSTLSIQSFLGGNTICNADEVIFSILSNLMEQFNFQEKEKVIHLSRWYNAVQNAKKTSTHLKFSRTPLY